MKNRYRIFCAERGLDGFERKPGGRRRRPVQYLVGIVAHRAWGQFLRERAARCR